MPNIQEKDAPNSTSHTTPTIESHMEEHVTSEAYNDSYDTWKQYKRVMSRDDPTTMLATTTALKGNTRAAKRNLRDEYLSIFPELLKAISNDKVARRNAAATLDATTESTIADSEALIDAVFPKSCIMKSQSFMGTEGHGRFRELFSDEEEDNHRDMCHHERRLKMRISQLILTYGSHPASDTPL